MSKMQGRSSQGRGRKQGSEKNTNPRQGRTRATGKVIKKSSDKEFKKSESKPSAARPAKPYARKEEGFDKSSKSGFKSKPSGDSKKVESRNSFSDKKPSYGASKKSESFSDKRERTGTGKPAFKKSSYGKDKSSESFSDNRSRSKGFKSAPKKSSTFSDGEGKLATKSGGFKTASKPVVTPKPKKTEDAEGGIRLNKYIANSGMCSRREADVFIQNGVVTVNGKMVDELGYKVQPGDLVKFDGRSIIPERPVYVLLNKPKDFITTSEDPQGRRTVMTLIEGACKERVFPVGRLDRNTTGLLLFTNDGEMADKLMHPRKRVKKIYLAELDKNLKTDHLQQLREGITLEDGPIKPDVVEYAAGPKPDKKTIGVEIHSGRNRIVRRMFEHFGYKVVKLDRVYFAGLTKKNLPRGRYRMLEPMEINMLKML